MILSWRGFIKTSILGKLFLGLKTEMIGSTGGGSCTIC